jgi:catechol 2,3-dioxygenase-like lactoylglutathione lyase family enzyme
MSMEAQQLHRGRLIDHIQLVVRDLRASRRFYEATLRVLSVPIGGEAEDYFWADELFVSTADSQAAHGQLTGRHHLAFQAADKAAVDAFYRAGIENGGKDNGAPGERPYHPGYYAAFLLDPDGNNVEAVYHGPAERSAKSVTIDFEA